MKTTPTTPSGLAHCKVENIIIDVFRSTWKIFEPQHKSYSLINAPMSGMSLKRGRNLLTFSAFNGFRRLALWGAVNGADINQGDGDLASMLGTGIYSRQRYMLDFILFTLRADPNLQYFWNKNINHPLQAMMALQWPAVDVLKIIHQGAVTRHQQDFDIVQGYLYANTKNTKPLQFMARERIQRLYNSGALILPEIAAKLPAIFINMLHEIDKHLLYHIQAEILTRKDMEAYQVHGHSFGHFLAFNGFSKSLNFHLRHQLPREQAQKKILTRDKFGYDMLLAAIHSNDLLSVAEVLNITSLSINQKIPAFEHYENAGKKPLDLAYEWDSSKQIIQLLKMYGATERIF